jgi:hypothetical protein
MLTPRQAADNAVFPFGDYLYDPARRLVCVAIPKNACTDLKHWFVSLVEPGKLAEPGFRLHAYVRATHTLAGKPRAEAERVVRESFTLAFVREPVSRVVSAYVETFVRPGPGALFEPAREVLAALGVEASRGITFREFVDFLERTPDEELESHWRPQACFVRGVRIDLLVRMEAAAPVLEGLGRELGMPPREARRPNATGYTPASGALMAGVSSGELHAKGVLPPVLDLVDDGLRRRVVSRFAEDAVLYERGAWVFGPEALARVRDVSRA